MRSRIVGHLAILNELGKGYLIYSDDSLSSSTKSPCPIINSTISGRYNARGGWGLSFPPSHSILVGCFSSNFISNSYFCSSGAEEEIYHFNSLLENFRSLAIRETPPILSVKKKPLKRFHRCTFLIL